MSASKAVPRRRLGFPRIVPLPPHGRPEKEIESTPHRISEAKDRRCRSLTTARHMHHPSSHPEDSMTSRAHAIGWSARGSSATPQSRRGPGAWSPRAAITARPAGPPSVGWAGAWSVELDVRQIPVDVGVSNCCPCVRRAPARSHMCEYKGAPMPPTRHGYWVNILHIVVIRRCLFG